MSCWIALSRAWRIGLIESARGRFTSHLHRRAATPRYSGTGWAGRAVTTAVFARPPPPDVRAASGTAPSPPAAASACARRCPDPSRPPRSNRRRECRVRPAPRTLHTTHTSVRYGVAPSADLSQQARLRGRFTMRGAATAPTLGTPTAWAMVALLPAAAGQVRAETADERDLRDFAAGNNLPSADVIGFHDHVAGARRGDVRALSSRRGKGADPAGRGNCRRRQTSPGAGTAAPGSNRPPRIHNPDAPERLVRGRCPAGMTQ